MSTASMSGRANTSSQLSTTSPPPQIARARSAEARVRLVNATTSTSDGPAFRKPGKCSRVAMAPQPTTASRMGRDIEHPLPGPAPSGLRLRLASGAESGRAWVRRSPGVRLLRPADYAPRHPFERRRSQHTSDLRVRGIQNGEGPGLPVGIRHRFEGRKGPNRKSPEIDEALGGLVVEGVAPAVGRQGRTVEGRPGGPPLHDDMAVIQREEDFSRYGSSRLRHERIQGPARGTVP